VGLLYDRHYMKYLVTGTAGLSALKYHQCYCAVGVGVGGVNHYNYVNLNFAGLGLE